MLGMLFIDRKTRMRAAVILVFLTIMWREAECTGGAEEMKLLHKKLLDDYNPAIRPSRNYSTPIEVSIQLHISVIMGLHWTDEYLQWDPRNYGEINRLVVPQNSIWKPDIIIHNAVNEHDMLGSERMFISVNSKGVAIWEPPFYLESTCKLDMSLYPFDVNVCPVLITSWMGDNKNLVFRWPNEPISMQHMMINGEYEISSAGIKKELHKFDDQFFESVIFQIRLARRPVYIAISLLIPVNLLAILGILSFILAPDEEEKVSISITIMLAFIVFLSVLDNNIPPTSDNVCLFVVYTAALLLMAFMSVMGNILIVTIEHWNQKDKKLTSPHVYAMGNVLRHPTNAVMAYKTAPQTTHDLLEADNCESLSSELAQTVGFIAANDKGLHKKKNCSYVMNKVFLILSCVAYIFVSCLMLVLLNV